MKKKSKKRRRQKMKNKQIGKKKTKSNRLNFVKKELDEEYESDDDEIELVQEKIQLEKWDPNYETFSRVVDKFFVFFI